MSPEFEFLNERIDHLSGVLSGAFQINAILLGFIIDKGVLTPQEVAKRLQDHFDRMPEDRRSKPHGLFLKLMLDLAQAELDTPSPSESPGGRPPWFRGIIDGSIE